MFPHNAMCLTWRSISNVMKEPKVIFDSFFVLLFDLTSKNKDILHKYEQAKYPFHFRELNLTHVMRLSHVTI